MKEKIYLCIHKNHFNEDEDKTIAFAIRTAF